MYTYLYWGLIGTVVFFGVPFLLNTLPFEIKVLFFKTALKKENPNAVLKILRDNSLKKAKYVLYQRTGISSKYGYYQILNKYSIRPSSNSKFSATMFAIYDSLSGSIWGWSIPLVLMTQTWWGYYLSAKILDYLIWWVTLPFRPWVRLGKYLSSNRKPWSLLALLMLLNYESEGGTSKAIHFVGHESAHAAVYEKYRISYSLIWVQMTLQKIDKIAIAPHLSIRTALRIPSARQILKIRAEAAKAPKKMSEEDVANAKILAKAVQ